MDWWRAEFVLTLLAFLGFITLPIRITTVYSGLPAHPLFVYVPVILIPSTIVAAIVFVIKPQWLTRYGIALAVVSIVAMSSVFLAMQAGAALRVVLVLLSIVAGYMCFRTGDLGAKAVWEGRIQAAHAARSGGLDEPGLAPPPGTGTP